MRRYLLNRAWQSAVTLVLVTVVVFLGVRALPGDPALALAGEESDPETLAAIRRTYGLDQPLPVQYWRYVGNAVSGDLGISIRTGLPVVTSIGARAAGDGRAGAVRDRDRHGRSAWAPASSPRCGARRPAEWAANAWRCSACRCRASGSG